MMRKEYENDLSQRLLEFSVEVILYLRTVKTNDETKEMKRQLLKCSTSGGANYEESQGAVSKADARNKIGISLKEIKEANYFLKIFLRLSLGDNKKCAYLVKESSELKRILGSIFNKLSTLFPWSLGLGIWNL